MDQPTQELHLGRSAGSVDNDAIERRFRDCSPGLAATFSLRAARLLHPPALQKWPRVGNRIRGAPSSDSVACEPSSSQPLALLLDVAVG